jgi:NitT/TauT family transport system substrate-binding protein
LLFCEFIQVFIAAKLAIHLPQGENTSFFICLIYRSFMRKPKLYSCLSLLLAFGLFLAACTPATPQPAQSVTLRLALLPVLDTLPVYVAQQEGLFAARGVNVEIIPVGSAPDRDQLIAAGQADGMINEVLSTMFYNREQVQVQVVRYARAATPSTRLFSILASGQSDINSLEQLKGVEIGISQGTVIEYLTDRLLESEGFTAGEIKSVAVPRIDLRMTLLGSGELKAAMLPEPLTSLALQQGARLIIDDTSHPQYSFSTLSFRKAVVDQNPEAVRAFLAAYEEAVSRINANPDQYSTLLSEQKLVPPPLEGMFKVPQFATAGVPTQEQWDDTLAWAAAKGLLAREVSYSSSVRADLLP